MTELIVGSMLAIDSLSQIPGIAYIVFGVVVFILFIALLQHFSKAKCPKCKKRKSKEISRKLLNEKRERRSRTVNGETEDYYIWVRRYDITYECKKCGTRFEKREKKIEDC